MNLSDSSSEDESNDYINAASRFNALNRASRTKNKIRDKEDEEDDEDEDDEDDAEDNDNVTAKNTDAHVSNDKQINKNINSNNIIEDLDDESDDCAAQDSESGSKCNDADEDVIIPIDDDDDDDIPNSRNKTTHRRSTRNSNKRHNTIPLNIQQNTDINLDDTIERILADTPNDSLNLSQEENNSFVVIGSPPPSKKCDIDNYEVSIKVLWRSNKMERFEIKRHETFQKVFRHFANLEGVSEDQILITKKDKRITPFDTPITIDWSIIDILDGGIVSAEVAKNNKGKGTQDEKEEDQGCKIKVQTSDRKTLTITLKSDQPFSILAKNCSEQLNIPETKMKFYFDGELIDTDETPESLDIDDEACIDLKIAK